MVRTNLFDCQLHHLPESRPVIFQDLIRCVHLSPGLDLLSVDDRLRFPVIFRETLLDDLAMFLHRLHEQIFKALISDLIDMFERDLPILIYGDVE